VYGLKLLRAEVEDVVWRGRQKAVFNSEELTISKTGETNGRIMRVYWWAKRQTNMDSELADLWSWLNRTIENTRRHRADQRKAHAINARTQSEEDAAMSASGNAWSPQGEIQGWRWQRSKENRPDSLSSPMAVRRSRSRARRKIRNESRQWLGQGFPIPCSFHTGVSHPN